MKTFKKIGLKKYDRSKIKKEENSIQPSGDHNVAKSKVSHKTIQCIIRLLDDSQAPLKYKLTKDELGQQLFDFVCESFGDLVERDYFGIRYRDKFDQEQWLDLSRSVYKQIRSSKSPELCFRLKHYPTDPVKDLKQNVTRYLVYLQIRRDMAQGRLACPPSMIASLGALIAQAEFGDAPEPDEPLLNTGTQNSPSHEPEQAQTENQNASKSLDDSKRNYLNGFTIFCSQTAEDEARIKQKHERLRGLTAQEAEVELLNRVSRLPTYGIVPFPVIPHHKIELAEPNNSPLQESKDNTKDSLSATQSRKFNLGISGEGLVVFVGLKKVQEIFWNQIHRLGCDGKHFLVYLKQEQTTHCVKRRHSISTTFHNLYGMRLLHSIPWPEPLVQGKSKQLIFDCESSAAALALWRWAVDRECFFTLKEAKQAKRLRPHSSIFHRNHSYRFSGKSYSELSSIPIKNTQTQFVRVASIRSPIQPDTFVSKYATLPGRLKPEMNLPEETCAGEVVDLVFRTEMEAPTAVIVPETVTEQPFEEAAVHIVFPTTENQDSESGLGEENDENTQPVEEVLIEPTETPSQQTPSKLGNETNAAEENTDVIRKRIDTDMVQSVVYEQVISALDQTLEDHTERFNGTLASENLPNGQPVRNAGESKNGTLSKRKYRDRAKQKPRKHRTDLEVQSDKKIILAVTVVLMLVGAIVAMETISTSEHSVARYIRRNSVISTLDSYIYIPIRNFAVSVLSAFWA